MRTSIVARQSHFSLCLASTLSLFVLAWAIHPAHADLAVHGGTARQRTAVETLYQQAIPEKFRRSELLPVRLLPDAAMNSSVYSGHAAANDDDPETIDGIAQADPCEILLRESRPESDMETVFAHEYGHFVWDNLLSAGQRTIFQRIYAVDRDEHHLVSEYAEASPEEGFAEAFGCFVLRPKLLAASDPRSSAFLTALIVFDRRQMPTKARLQSREWEERDSSR